MLCSGLLMHPDDLRGARRVSRLNLAAGSHPLPADDQRILMPEQVAAPLQRSSHGVGIHMLRKVDEGLIAECALRLARQDNGGSLEGCHNSLVYSNFACAGFGSPGW